MVLDRCTEISERGARELAARLPDEFAFGNYEAGRFAWVLRDVEQLAVPVAFRGSQGFFDVPDELLAAGVAG